MCWSGCHFVRHLLAKLKTIQIWNLVHTQSQTISKNGFFVFFEKVALRAVSLEKTSVSLGLSAYILDCLVFFYFWKKRPRKPATSRWFPVIFLIDYFVSVCKGLLWLFYVKSVDGSKVLWRQYTRSWLAGCKRAANKKRPFQTSLFPHIK